MRRIVVRGPNWLGDLVMALPALAAVRAAYPRATLALAAPAPFAPFCAAVPGVDLVVPLPGSGVRAIGGHAAALAAGGFDAALLLTNSLASALAASRAGIPERWGYRRDFRGRWLTRAVDPRQPDAADPSRPPSRHHRDYYLRLLAALGIAAVPGPFTVAVPAEAHAAAAALLAPLATGNAPIVGFAPGAAYGLAKRWPPPLVAEAIASLSAAGVATLLVGAPADRPTARAIQSALAARGRTASPGGPPLDLVGETDLGGLMGVLARCAVVVANDSGAMHVASAVGRPVVAVFGPTDEQATSPIGPHTIVRHEVWCRPCLLRECPIDHRCLRRIPAAAVVSAVHDLLAAGDAAGGGAAPGAATAGAPEAAEGAADR
jgi:heptosyltransferase II